SLYNSMDAGEAYVELFDSTPLVAILGEAANNFGPQLTVGQLKASYLNKDAFSRLNFREQARADVRYAGKRHDFPYTFEEAFEGDADTRVSDYQVFVDALIGAADLELSADPKTGIVNKNSRFYVRDQKIQAQLEDAFAFSRSGLEKL